LRPGAIAPSGATGIAGVRLSKNFLPALLVTGDAGARRSPPPRITPHVPAYAAGAGYGPSGDENPF